MRFGPTVICAAIAVTTLSGCTTISESDYKLGRSYIAENPSIKRELINDCIADRRRESIGEQKTGAAFINVSVAKYPQTFCSRVINAYVNGKLTYSDIQNASLSSADNSKFVRILQGR
jgi:hypothetical protein